MCHLILDCIKMHVVQISICCQSGSVCATHLFKSLFPTLEKRTTLNVTRNFYLKETYSVFSYRLLKLSASTQTKTAKTMDDPHFIKKQRILSFPFFFPPFFRYFLEHWHISYSKDQWYVNWNRCKMNLRSLQRSHLKQQLPLLVKLWKPAETSES